MITRKPEEIIEMDVAQLESLVARIEQGTLEREDLQTLRAVLESYFYVTRLIDDKSTTIARLRKLVFGATTEKTAEVTGRCEQDSAAEDKPPAGAASTETPGRAAGDLQAAGSKKGHGRNGADAYSSAQRVKVRHESLQPGAPCPACGRGTAYELTRPGVLIRFVGQPPVQATIYELQKLRCHLCGKVFTAQAPEAAGQQKYEATAASMIGLLKYGSGVPFNRLQGLQGSLGVPLPASTQWEIVHAAVPDFQPVHEALIRQAAGGDVIHNDDTSVKILERMGARAKHQAFAAALDEEAEKNQAERKGLFTSGVVAEREGRRIALFFSGSKHAGENLGDVLRQRAAELPPPIQMCDALSRNRPGELQTILANCLAHARRQFIDVHDRFPDECRYVLEAIEIVYGNDAAARRQAMTAETRLRFHQAESGPVLDQLRDWLKRQIDEKLVEPHSGLGAAIQYLRKHWDKLTLFLRQAGAPLDNNVVERALKKAILHRKNALFYKTQNGASTGDLYMSLIHTCELNDVNPFDYLTAVQQHADQVAAAPDRWLPWNYRDALSAA
ncbi:MAG TPA: IS66 family transposase [Planctomycetaceae bacterium]|jgi:transposase|nr:IS66 family transposase [Planctomycetaceae bacterium]